LNKEIIISSSGINAAKVKRVINLIKRSQESGVDITVITLEPENYTISQIEKTRQLIEQLLSVGIRVKLMPIMHEHYAIIDREIVWYGSINLLSREKDDDNLMRVESSEIAQELMEMTFKIVNQEEL